METVNAAKIGNYYGEDVESCIKILYENKYHCCITSSTDLKKVRNLVKDILQEIKQRNAKIQDINKQMLPSVYYWDAEEADTPTSCAEISIGEFEKQAQCLYMFTTPIYSVLTDPSARKPLAKQALASLAMLGYMADKNNKEKENS